jgi:signal transduction histidine kinase
MRQGSGPPPRRRPPWWPEGEPFPPTNRWGHRGPPPFIRRVGCFFIAVLAAAVLTGVVVGGLAAQTGPWPVALAAFVLVFLTVVAGFGGLRRMTRPVAGLVDAATRIESGDYSAHVPESGPRDLRSVARAFNSMSARLKTSDEQRRTFLADVAHEMRTPLSVIRGHAEAIADGVYPGDAAHLAPIVDATKTLERLVEDLRTLVLTDAGNLVLRKELTDVAALIRETVGSFSAQADSAGVALHTDIADQLPSLEIDPARIRGVIGNLLSNSIRHTPPGGRIAVEVKASGEAMEVTVIDSGEGISPELLPHVLERFVKGPGSPGSGLGLSIAHDIAAAHGGSLKVESEEGSGTQVKVKLPIGR